MIKRLFACLFIALLPISASAQTVPQSREQVQMSFSPVVKQVAPAVVVQVTIIPQVVREHQDKVIAAEHLLLVVGQVKLALVVRLWADSNNLL